MFQRSDDGVQQFQSTHPVWGATFRMTTTGTDTRISIHAPRVGCDSIAAAGYEFGKVFQSTHPVWGATPSDAPGPPGRGISIHAPRVGCDITCEYYHVRFQDFNPRTPCGVRPVGVAPGCGIGGISIHAPRVGCDPFILSEAQQGKISIHAPRVGCDFMEQFSIKMTEISIHAPRVGCDDNRRKPRSPRSKFQSTHPVWGATGRPKALMTLEGDFNPRTPCGVRLLSLPRSLTRRNFNPRTPCGVRRQRRSPGSFRTLISIHAPRVGCDCASSSSVHVWHISIHAPRVGCDLCR